MEDTCETQEQPMGRHYKPMGRINQRYTPTGVQSVTLGLAMDDPWVSYGLATLFHGIRVEDPWATHEPSLESDGSPMSGP